jgi:F420-dependent oxidoreductase-like protein
MKFSIWPSPHHQWEDVVRLATHADQSGWDRILFSDHFMADNGPAPTLECWASLSALAALTSNVDLGSLVSSVSYRHPAVLANAAVTIDRISQGRLVLGLGAGWQQNEHRAYGIPLLSVGERLDRFEEACRITAGLLRQDHTTFIGRYFTTDEAEVSLEATDRIIPLLLGGPGERRTVRIVAELADEWNCWGRPEVIAAKSAVLDRHCHDVSRDPASISRSAQALVYLSEDAEWVRQRRERAATLPMPAIVGTPDEIADELRAYRAAGVDHFVMPDFNLGPVDRALQTMTSS